MFVRNKRAAPARRGKAAPKRAKAKPQGGLHLPAAIEQRHLDLIGLFLVAAGVYLVFVLFLGWEGGKVGYGIETGLGYLFGKVGSRIFTLLILFVGAMLLTGTSVSALARAIGRGVGALFHAVFIKQAEEPDLGNTQAEWRRHREAADETGATDVMRDYPEEDEDFNPTVAIADDSPFAEGVFDYAADAAETQVVPEDSPGNPEGGPGMPGREAEDMPVDSE